MLRDTRTGCEAMFRITRPNDDDRRVVDKFSDAHNHPLTTPSKVLKHRSHNKFQRSESCSSLVKVLGKSGLGPSQIAKAVNTMTGSQEPDITPKQCVNNVRVHKRCNIGKECYGVIKYFQQKAVGDDSFFFAV